MYKRIILVLLFVFSPFTFSQLERWKVCRSYKQYKNIKSNNKIVKLPMQAVYRFYRVKCTLPPKEKLIEILKEYFYLQIKEDSKKDFMQLDPVETYIFANQFASRFVKLRHPYYIVNNYYDNRKSLKNFIEEKDRWQGNGSPIHFSIVVSKIFHFYKDNIAKNRFKGVYVIPVYYSRNIARTLFLDFKKRCLMSIQARMEYSFSYNDRPVNLLDTKIYYKDFSCFKFAFIIALLSEENKSSKQIIKDILGTISFQEREDILQGISDIALVINRFDLSYSLISSLSLPEMFYRLYRIRRSKTKYLVKSRKKVGYIYVSEDDNRLFRIYKTVFDIKNSFVKTRLMPKYNNERPFLNSVCLVKEIDLLDKAIKTYTNNLTKLHVANDKSFKDGFRRQFFRLIKTYSVSKIKKITLGFISKNESLIRLYNTQKSIEKSIKSIDKSCEQKIIDDMQIDLYMFVKTDNAELMKNKSLEFSYFGSCFCDLVESQKKFLKIVNIRKFSVIRDQIFKDTYDLWQIRRPAYCIQLASRLNILRNLFVSAQKELLGFESVLKDTVQDSDYVIVKAVYIDQLESLVYTPVTKKENHKYKFKENYIDTKKINEIKKYISLLQGLSVLCNKYKEIRNEIIISIASVIKDYQYFEVKKDMSSLIRSYLITMNTKGISDLLTKLNKIPSLVETYGKLWNRYKYYRIKELKEGNIPKIYLEGGVKNLIRLLKNVDLKGIQRNIDKFNKTLKQINE